MVKVDLGEWIKDVRLSNGLSTNEMAERLEITPVTLSKMENNKRQVDSETLIKCVEEFNVFPVSNEDQKPTYAKLEYEIDKNEVTAVLKKLKELGIYYSEYRQLPFANNPLKKIVVDELPSLIQKGFNLNDDDYKITGSIGKGQFAEVLWVCIFLKNVTKSATRGFYIVFLFDADGKSVYMSLNQGWTYFQERYSTKEGRHLIRVAAEKMKKIIQLEESEWLTGPIDLGANGVLASGYEFGNVFAKKYDLANLPSEQELSENLETLLTAYNTLNVIRGKESIFDFFANLLLGDDGYVEEVEEAYIESIEEESKKLSEKQVANIVEQEPQLAKSKVKTMEGREIYPRDARVAAAALSSSNHVCAANGDHPLFISKVSGMPYLECHHLIPVSTQDQFEFSLDCIDNIAILCPSCHRLIHHGIDEQRLPLLQKLHDSMKSGLEKMEIGISFKELKALYNIK